MTYETWCWYRPDDSWKDDEPAPASLEARQSKIERPVSQLLMELLDQFGQGVTVDLQIEHEAATSPAFNLLGVGEREGHSVALLRFTDDDGAAEVCCAVIRAVRVLD